MSDLHSRPHGQAENSPLAHATRSALTSQWATNHVRNHSPPTSTGDAILKKLIIGFIVVVIFAAVGVALFVPSYADRRVHEAVEQRASRALGVETTVGEADVAILGGNVTLTDLRVANPQGFDQADHLLTIDDIQLHVSLGSLTDDKVVAPTLELTGIHLALEKHPTEANYKVILDRLREYESGDQSGASARDARPPSDSADSSSARKNGKRFVIEKIVLRDVRVSAYVESLLQDDPRPVEVDIPSIEMRYASDEGLTVDQLSALTTKVMMASVVRNAGHLLPSAIVRGIKRGLTPLVSLTEFGLEITVGAAKLVGQVGQGVVEGTGEAIETIGEGIDEAFQ